MAAAAASIATCSDSFMMVVLVPFGKLWGFAKSKRKQQKEIRRFRSRHDSTKMCVKLCYEVYQLVKAEIHNRLFVH